MRHNYMKETVYLLHFVPTADREGVGLDKPTLPLLASPNSERVSLSTDRPIRAPETAAPSSSVINQSLDVSTR